MIRSGHAILAAGAALGLLAGCSSGGSTAASTTTTTRAPAASGGTSTSSGAASSVTIQGRAFEPPSLTVKLGTQVTWTNRDEIEHTVTAIPGDTLMFDGTVPGGSKYSYTFTRTGDFPYACRIHPGMRGTISVTQ